MLSLNIFVGNVGCGKSVISHKLMLSLGAVVVNMDSIQAMVSVGDYDRYDNEKKNIYHAIERETIESALRSGLSVAIDRTNMDAKRRQKFLEIGKRYGARCVAYNWGSGTEEDLSRRIKSPRGIPRDRWRQVYEYMQRSYEEPTIEEGFDDIIEPPTKYRFHAFDFDGIIVVNKSPDIGGVVTGTVDQMNKLFEDLSNIIIVWSCRGGDMDSQMREFLNKRKIPYDFINENPLWEPGSRKIFAHVYYDDRNGTIGDK